MSIAEMRQWIVDYYKPRQKDPEAWRRRVDKMSSSQICAIYFRLKNQEGKSRAS